MRAAYPPGSIGSAPRRMEQRRRLRALSAALGLSGSQQPEVDDGPRLPQHAVASPASSAAGGPAGTTTPGAGGAAAATAANGKWQLMLSQDRNLGIVAGSFATAAAAVKRGADLRLYMVTDTYGTNYEEVMNFKQSLWRSTPGPTQVAEHSFSGLGPFLSSVHHGRDISEPYASFFSYDTCRTVMQTPTHSLMKLLPDGSALDESNRDPPANYDLYRWFIRDRYRLVYEHDADGVALNGSKDELKAAVRAGQTIRVGIWQLSGLQDEHEESGAGGRRPGVAKEEELSFLETTQPTIPIANKESRSYVGHDGHAGEVNLACDPVMIPAATATWPLDFREGLSIASLVPATSGNILAFISTPTPGGAATGPRFRRTVLRRAMRWVVADD